MKLSDEAEDAILLLHPQDDIQSDSHSADFAPFELPSYRKLLASDVDCGEALTLLRRLASSDSSIAAFGDDTNLKTLVECMTILRIPAGERIVARGEEASFCGIILEGVFEAHVPIPSPNGAIAPTPTMSTQISLPRGSFIGEMACLDACDGSQSRSKKGTASKSNCIRNADVFCMSDSGSKEPNTGIVAVIRFDELSNLCELHPSFGRRVSMLFARAAMNKMQKMIVNMQQQMIAQLSRAQSRRGSHEQQHNQQQHPAQPTQPLPSHPSPSALSNAECNRSSAGAVVPAPSPSSSTPVIATPTGGQCSDASSPNESDTGHAANTTTTIVVKPKASPSLHSNSHTNQHHTLELLFRSRMKDKQPPSTSHPIHLPLSSIVRSVTSRAATIIRSYRERLEQSEEELQHTSHAKDEQIESLRTRVDKLDQQLSEHVASLSQVSKHLSQEIDARTSAQALVRQLISELDACRRQKDDLQHALDNECQSTASLTASLADHRDRLRAHGKTIVSLEERIRNFESGLEKDQTVKAYAKRAEEAQRRFEQLRERYCGRVGQMRRSQQDIEVDVKRFKTLLKHVVVASYVREHRLKNSLSESCRALEDTVKNMVAVTTGLPSNDGKRMIRYGTSSADDLQHQGQGRETSPPPPSSYSLTRLSRRHRRRSSSSWSSLMAEEVVTLRSVLDELLQQASHWKSTTEAFFRRNIDLHSTLREQSRSQIQPPHSPVRSQPDVKLSAEIKSASDQSGQHDKAAEKVDNDHSVSSDKVDTTAPAQVDDGQSAKTSRQRNVVPPQFHHQQRSNRVDLSKRIVDLELQLQRQLKESEGMRRRMDVLRTENAKFTKLHQRQQELLSPLSPTPTNAHSPSPSSLLFFPQSPPPTSAGTTTATTAAVPPRPLTIPDECFQLWRHSMANEQQQQQLHHHPQIYQPMTSASAPVSIPSSVLPSACPSAPASVPASRPRSPSQQIFTHLRSTMYSLPSSLPSSASSSVSHGSSPPASFAPSLSQSRASSHLPSRTRTPVVSRKPSIRELERFLFELPPLPLSLSSCWMRCASDRIAPCQSL